MEAKCYFRFLLMDFGHPMNCNSINHLVNTLQNVLTLGLAFSHNGRELTFGIAILNSDFAVFDLQSNIRKNYETAIKNLNTVLRRAHINSKVTVQEYRYSLSRSIKAILQEFQKFKRSNFSSQSTDPEIEVAIVTKKTAPVLADILTDVTNKLQSDNPSISSVAKYKIIQILSKQEEIFKSSDRNKLIHWTTCLDNPDSLGLFFKEWLLSQQRRLRILLSKELNLEMKCDVEDCLVNPVTTDGSSSSNLGILPPADDLEVINRLPLSGVSPKFVYGIPRRISPSQSGTEIGWKIYGELCRELHRTGQGLLAKSALPTEKPKLNSFHLLTSDGHMLLMNDVAPEELYLPSRTTFSKPADPHEGGNAASTIRLCLEKIKLLDEYDPRRFSSGICGHLKNYLLQSTRKKTSIEQSDAMKSRKIGFDEKDGDVRKKQEENGIENRKRRSKSSSETELENVHPALLSPNVVKKYRKISSRVFNLPELSEEYSPT